MLKAPQGLIDAHHHLWDLDQLYYPWLSDQFTDQTFMGDYQDLCQNYSVNDFKNDALPYQLLGSVHIEAEHDRSNIFAELNWLVEQHSIFKLPTAIVAYAPLLDANIIKILNKMNEYALFRGIRFKPQTSPSPKLKVSEVKGSLFDPNLVQSLEHLANNNLVWDARVPYWHLEDLYHLAKKVPHLSIILEHSGLPWDRTPHGLNIWSHGMQQLAQLHNVSVKLSELSTENQNWPYVENIGLMKNILTWFGIDRCLFASNYPVAKRSVPYSVLVHAAMDALAGYSQYEKDLFFIQNATRIYQIE